MPDAQRADPREAELAVLLHRRFSEAEAAGLTLREALAFAKSEIDIGELRHLIERGCPPRLIASILL